MRHGVALGNAEERSLFDCSGIAIMSDCTKRELKADSSMKRRRSTQREQLHTLRQEVSALGQHLQELNENRQLQLSLDRLLNESTTSAMSWKNSATRERHAKESSEERKTEALRRISVNMSFLENVKHALLTQAHQITGSPSLHLPMRCVPVGLDDDDAQLYQALKSGLDYRCSQLDAILQQCVSGIDTPESHESFIHADGRGVDVREISIKPFGMTTISNVMLRYMEEHASLFWYKENDVYIKRILELGEFSSDGRPLNVRNRSVMRRFVYQNQMIMLWETVIVWNNDHRQASEPETTRLRQKGWVVLRPFEDLGGGVCLTQKGISIQLQETDGSDSLIMSPEVTAVLKPLRAFGKKQMQIIENMMVDVTMK